MKIVADNTIPFLKGIAEPEAEVRYLPAKGFTPEAIRDADALIVRSIDKCTPELLTGSSVKLITTATIGFDHIDTHYCELVLTISTHIIAMCMELLGRMRPDAMRLPWPSICSLLCLPSLCAEVNDWKAKH